MEILKKSGPAYEKRYELFLRWKDSVPKWHTYFVFSPIDKPNFVKPTKPLSECKVALVSSAGVHLNTQPAFDVVSDHGDWSFREIPADTPPENLLISDTHYDHEEADEDINCMFPITHLRTLADEGFIGDVATNHYSFMGFVPDPKDLLADTAPDVANRLKEDGVDLAILTPGCAFCHQTIGLAQNTIEGVGIPTISITLKPALTEQINVPRAVNIRFPYGSAVGSAFDPEQQISIVKDTLKTLYEIEEPTTIVRLPYRWRGRKA